MSRRRLIHFLFPDPRDRRSPRPSRRVVRPSTAAALCALWLITFGSYSPAPRYLWLDFTLLSCGVFRGGTLVAEVGRGNCQRVDVGPSAGRLRPCRGAACRFADTQEWSRPGANVAAIDTDGKLLAERDPYVLFDVSYLNGGPKSLSGIALPRLDQPLFRGLRAGHPQINPPKLLRAILGDASAPIESKAFSQMRASLDASLPEDVLVHETKLALRNRLGCSQRNRVEQRRIYIDRGSGFFQNYPEDMMFSTYYPGIARDYYARGAVMLALHDHEHRGVDVNHAMQCVGENGAPQDRGEYIMPLFIDPSELDGVFFLGLQVSVMAVSENGIRYGLLFRGTPCLFVDDQGSIKTCRERSLQEYALYEPPLQAVETPAPFAVLALCNDGAECRLPEGFYQRYGVVPTRPGAQRTADLDFSAVRVGHKHAELFYDTADVTADVPR